MVQGNILPKIDDAIDSALGLVVLYQYLRELALNEQHQKGPVNVLTTEMFAHYFSTKHLLVARYRLMPKAQDEQSVQAAKLCLREEIKLFCNRIVSAPRLLVSDLVLCKLPNNRIASDCLSDNSDRRQMVSLITRLSLQQLLTYCHLMLPRDIAMTDISDFLALYLYRCHLYERCEQLCQQRIRQLIDADRCNMPRVSSTYHNFAQLMDDDVVSLFGLTALIDKSRVQSWFSEPVTITQLTMYLYLFTACQIELDPETKSDADVLSSLAIALDWIAVAQKMIPADESVDHLMLKLAERKAVIYITEQLTGQNNKCTPRQEDVKSVSAYVNRAQFYIISITDVIMYLLKTR